MQPDMFLSVPLHGQATAAGQAKPVVVPDDADFGEVFARLQNEALVTAPGDASGPDDARLNGNSQEAGNDAVPLGETDDVEAHLSESELEGPPKRAQVTDPGGEVPERDISFVTVRKASDVKEAGPRFSGLAGPALLGSEPPVASSGRDWVPDESWGFEQGRKFGSNVRRGNSVEVAPGGLEGADFKSENVPLKVKSAALEVTPGLVSGSIATEGLGGAGTEFLDPKSATIAAEQGRGTAESRDSEDQAPARAEANTELNAGRWEPDYHLLHRTLPASGSEDVPLNRANEVHYDPTGGVPYSRNAHEISALDAVPRTTAVSAGGETGRGAAPEAGQVARVRRLPETLFYNLSHIGDYRHGHGVRSPEDNDMVRQVETEGMPDGGLGVERLEANAQSAAVTTTMPVQIGDGRIEPTAFSSSTVPNHADGSRRQIVGETGAIDQIAPAGSREGATAGQVAPAAKSSLRVGTEAIDGDDGLVTARENPRITRSGNPTTPTSVTLAEVRTPERPTFAPTPTRRTLSNVTEALGSPLTGNERVGPKPEMGATEVPDAAETSTALRPVSPSTDGPSMEPLPAQAAPASAFEHGAKQGWSEAVDRRHLGEERAFRRRDVDSVFMPRSHDAAKPPTPQEVVPLAHTQVAKPTVSDVESPKPVAVSERPGPMMREGSGQMSGPPSNAAQYVALTQDVTQQASAVTWGAPHVSEAAGSSVTENERVRPEWRKRPAPGPNATEASVAQLSGSPTADKPSMETRPVRAVPVSGLEQEAKSGRSEVVDRRHLGEESAFRRRDVDSAFTLRSHDTAKPSTPHDVMPLADKQVAKPTVSDVESPQSVGVSERPGPLTREGSGQMSGPPANAAQYVAMTRDVAQQSSAVTRGAPQVSEAAGSPVTENERVRPEWRKRPAVGPNAREASVGQLSGSPSADKLSMNPLPVQAVPVSGLEQEAKSGRSEVVDRQSLVEGSTPGRSEVDSAFIPRSHDTVKPPTPHDVIPLADKQVAKPAVSDADSSLPVGVSEMPGPLTREGSGQMSGPPANPAQYVALARDVAQQLSVVTRVAPGEVTEVSLRPDELGHVRMRLAASDGQIVLQILSERPETHDLMRRHIDIVERAFRDLGFQDIAFDFSFSGQRDGSGQGEVDPAAPEEAVANDTPLPAETTQRRLALSARLDIRL